MSGREIEQDQGREDAPDFGETCSLRVFCSIFAALPGAPAPGKARRPQPYMACRDGDSFPLEEQYFKERTQGTSCRKC